MSTHVGKRGEIRDFDLVADEARLDEAITRVQREYPHESWRGAELRDLLGLALSKVARTPRVPRQR